MTRERAEPSLVWRPMATEDLQNIVRYIGKDNPSDAKKFGQLLRSKVAALAKPPQMGKAGRIEGYRELVVHANYIVLYQVLGDTNTVQIVRIKHAAERI